MSHVIVAEHVIHAINLSPERIAEDVRRYDAECVAEALQIELDAESLDRRWCQMTARERVSARARALLAERDLDDYINYRRNDKARWISQTLETND